MSLRPRLALAVLASSLFAACCGSGEESATSSGRITTAPTLPPSCTEVHGERYACDETFVGRTKVVICRGRNVAEGAPAEMVTRLSCKYLTTTVPSGNVYCCPP